MKKLLFLLLFLVSTSLLAQKIAFSLNKKGIDSTISFYKKMVEKKNGATVFKEEFKHIDSLHFYNIKYKSFDNLNIGGFLIEPKKSGVYPVLIYNRGGNGDYGETKDNFLIYYLSRIASKGYIVISSQLRGSSVSEGNDEFGGKDVNDALDIIKIIDELPNTNKEKIGVFGWSRGVMTNFLMLKQTNRIKTNIAIAGPADLALNDRPIMFEVFRERIPNYDNDKDNQLKQRSSLLAIDSIQNKQLTNFIIQGNKDTSVKVDNAFLLYNKLIEKNFKTKLLIYDDEEHGLKGVFENLMFTICDWLDTKLK